MARSLRAFVKTLLPVALLLVPLPTFGADVPVTYLVDAKALKGATATTPLTFTLYGDAGCTSVVATQTIDAGSVDVIEQLKRLVARPSPKPPTTARVTTTVTHVTWTGNLFLTVAGAGITPAGGACQAQTAQAGPPHLTTVPGVKFRAYGADGGNVLCPLDTTSAPPLQGHCVSFVDRASVALVLSLSPSVLHQCDIETTVGSNGTVSSYLSGLFLAFGIGNCSDLPASCSDGIQNQDETSTDCGGTHCPSCSDYHGCNVASDCTNGHCVETSCGYCNCLQKLCVPPFCFNGVKDLTEADVDCGFSACRLACGTGQTCIFDSSTSCDCASQVCSDSICQ